MEKPQFRRKQIFWRFGRGGLVELVCRTKLQRNDLFAQLESREQKKEC